MTVGKIDPDEYERILDDGHQGRRTELELRGGAGLLLVRNIVDAHKATVVIHSEPHNHSDDDHDSLVQEYFYRHDPDLAAKTWARGIIRMPGGLK